MKTTEKEMNRFEIWLLLGLQAASLAVLVGRLYYDKKRYQNDVQRRLWRAGKQDEDSLRAGFREWSDGGSDD